MPSSSTPALTHISDTARWVAYYRAMESDRPDALFRDPYARQLAGEQGETIVRTLPKGRAFAWPMIVRTALLDELILRAVQRDGVDTVVNLAAGLDTRPYRLALPRSLKWIDADLPAMIEYKQEVLARETPSCTLESVKIDLTDPARRAAFFHQVGGTARQALVVTEGLLIYLTREQVSALARDVHRPTSFRWWLIDLASPRLLKLMERTWSKPLQAAGAPFQFAPAEGTKFFEPLGWREVEWRPMFHESVRLNRSMRMARFWLFVARFYTQRMQEEFRRMSGVAMLERQ